MACLIYLAKFGLGNQLPRRRPVLAGRLPASYLLHSVPMHPITSALQLEVVQAPGAMPAMMRSCVMQGRPSGALSLRNGLSLGDAWQPYTHLIRCHASPIMFTLIGLRARET